MGKEFEKEQIHVYTTEVTATTLKHRVPEDHWVMLHSGGTGEGWIPPMCWPERQWMW